MINRVVNTISNRLSLRAPQRQSLEALQKAIAATPDILHPQRDTAAMLGILKAEFPKSSDFERPPARGMRLLPEWLLADKVKNPEVVSLRFKNLPLSKTMYLATRHEDVQLEYLQWLIEHAQSRHH